MTKIDLLPLLDYINPSALDYSQWVNLGMALKSEGYTASVWDDWSSRDFSRYKSGECFKKWTTFTGDAVSIVTAGTIVKMAKEGGWVATSKEDKELGWDDIIGNKNDLVIIDKNWVEGKEICEPKNWDPNKQLIRYLKAVFESTDNVGYVTRSLKDGKSGKYLPATKGAYDRTAGKLIQELSQSKNNDIGSVLGDYDVKVGAWIRFNPLDGKGVRGENVTNFKHTLVESDTLDVEKQNEILRTLELPITALVHSGGKSLHAIVKIDAQNYDEYRKRVDYLYKVCRKNGLDVDEQNKNPSRLSRMPGVLRSGNKQFLLDTNIGKSSYNEWKEWIEAVNDDLPEPESINDIWGNLPELAKPLIDNVLRQGHKMLIAGPSKAGKSYALINLCCAIAEGKKWLNFKCTQGKVLYVNLELDRASCLHRFKDVYSALGFEPNNLNNIDVWNLRGKSIPMDKLAPKLIRRASKKNYIAVIIDPIYKIITGDENSADQMAHFCNQFDKVCTELSCAVIYCHHHSKGGQGNKRSMDRASGSGVFARDPDSLLDLIELDISESLLKHEENKAVCKLCLDFLNDKQINYKEDLSQDDVLVAKIMLEYLAKKLSREEFSFFEKVHVDNAKKKVQMRTAWRIEGTLREFPRFMPLNLWFEYPVHFVDENSILKDASPEGEKSWQANFKNKKSPEQTKKDRQQSLFLAFESACFNGKATLQSMAEYLGVGIRTVKTRINENGNFVVTSQGEVTTK